MMSNIVFLAERWPFAWRPRSLFPRNLVKNKCLLIMWRSLPPRLKARIRPSRSGTLWVGSTYPPSGRVSGSSDRKAQKPAAPSFAEEIHLSTEVTCCFWPWPHPFLRCFPPERSRILSLDRTIPWMYVRTPRNLRGGYSSWPTETALGSFECRRERRSVRESARPARRLSAFRLPLLFHSRRSARTSVDRLPRMFFSVRRSRARGNPLCAFGWARNLAHRAYLYLRNIGPQALRRCLLNATGFSGAPGL